MAFYLGDHDPSGIDMTRDVDERVCLLGGNPCFTGTAAFPLNIDVRRLALNIAQVRQYNPPENPAKESDSRSPNYISKFGPSSWELDAIEPRTLAALVTDAVTALRDDEKWAAALAKESKMRLELTKFAKKYDKKPRRKK